MKRGDAVAVKVLSVVIEASQDLSSWWRQVKSSHVDGGKSSPLVLQEASQVLSW
jgi:hypothetical protein